MGVALDNLKVRILLIRLIFLAIFSISLLALKIDSFGQSIPTPQPKVYCRDKGEWMTPEEYSRSCRRSGPLSSPHRGLSPGEEITLEMLKGMLQPIFNALFDFSNLFGSPAEKQKEGSKKAIEAWNNHLREAEEEAKREATARMKAGEEVLSKIRIGEKPLSTFTVLTPETSLAQIDWNNPRQTDLSFGVSQVYTDSAKERLLKTAYFSKMAEVAMLNGDLEAARFWATVAFEDTSVSPRDVSYKPPKELIDAMDTRKALEMNKRLTRYSSFFREALPKFDSLKQILIKVNEVRIKKGEYEEKIKEVDGKIRELEYQKDSLQIPAEREKITDLLSRAIALKEEVEAEYRLVQKEEERLLNEKQTLEKELFELKKRLIREEM